MDLQLRRGVNRRSFLALAAAAGATGAAADEPASKPAPLSPLEEAQLKAILAKHGKHLSAQQKAELPRLIASIHKTSLILEAFPLPENSEPALAFRVYRADRR
jgi:hypothetical protein